LAVSSPFWAHLAEGLRTGLPQNEIRTGDAGLFETLYTDPARLRQFLAAVVNAFGLMMSLNMLIETPAGFDYTSADCAGWMTAAGFSTTRVEPLVGPDSMVIGT
jgi:hypothetical protein